MVHVNLAPPLITRRHCTHQLIESTEVLILKLHPAWLGQLDGGRANNVIYGDADGGVGAGADKLGGGSQEAGCR